MSYLEIVDRVLEKQQGEEKAKPQKTDISLLRLSELARRNIAIKIYSEILGCEIWLYGNEQMAAQIKRDSPGAVTYTANELRELYKLQPSPEDLRTLHNTKAVFDGSQIVDSSLKETNDGSDRT